MASTRGPGAPSHDEEDAAELAELAAALRMALRRHQRAGRWAASAGPTLRPEVAPPLEEAGDLAGSAAPAAPQRSPVETSAPPRQTAAAPGPGGASASRTTSISASESPSVTSASSATSVGARDSEPWPADEPGRFDEVPLPPEDAMPPELDMWGEPIGPAEPMDAALDGGRASGNDRGTARGRDSGRAPAGPPRREPASRAPRATGAAGAAGAAGAGLLDDAFEPSRGRRTLAMVRQELGDCQRCKLSRSRNKLVFGAGAQDAALVFVGEAPGADEDRTGEPFVGRAGELLNKMIEAMGWTRQSVYIANLLKCRPPGNRNPEPDETRECRPFLIAQLEVIAPRIIVALGRPAANALLGTDAPISTLRGKFHERRGIRILPTFHPAYLLREPAKKRDAWEDLKLVMTELTRIGVATPGGR